MKLIDYAIAHQGLARRWAYHFGVPFADAQDVVQEALLVALRKGDVEYPAPYFYSIVRSKSIDHFRRQRRLVPLEAKHDRTGGDVEYEAMVNLQLEEATRAAPATKRAIRARLMEERMTGSQKVLLHRHRKKLRKVYA